MTNKKQFDAYVRLADRIDEIIEATKTADTTTVVIVPHQKYCNEMSRHITDALQAAQIISEESRSRIKIKYIHGHWYEFKIFISPPSLGMTSATLNVSTLFLPPKEDICKTNKDYDLMIEHAFHTVKKIIVY